MLCVCVCVCVFDTVCVGWCLWVGVGVCDLASLRLLGQCLAECALNCKCRYKQGTSRYKDRCRCKLGKVQMWGIVSMDRRLYLSGHMQILNGIRADTNRGTCMYEQGYMQIQKRILADTSKDTCNINRDKWWILTKQVQRLAHKHIWIHTPKYMQKYIQVRILQHRLELKVFLFVQIRLNAH